MRLNVRDVAAGKWRGILEALGFDKAMLDGKHRPCPACGGKDRWRFDDKEGHGTSYCSQCGATDGVGLVMKVKGIDFRTAAMEVEKAAGFIRPETMKPAKVVEEVRASLRRVWLGSVPLTDGDPVVQYLTGRGLVRADSGFGARLPRPGKRPRIGLPPGRGSNATFCRTLD